MNEENKSKNVGLKVLVILLIVCILGAGGLLAFKIWKDQSVQEASQNDVEQKAEEPPVAPVVTLCGL